MQRRSFLAALGGATAALGLGGASSAVAAACARAASDGRAIRPLGLQLYTVRTLMAEDVPRTLGRVAEAGYTEVEFAGYFDHAPAALRRILDDHGLTAPSAHVPFDALGQEGGWARAIEAAHALGHRYLVIAFIPPESRRTLDDYHRLAERFERAGAEAAAAGVRFAYHNHEFEFAPIRAITPYEIIARTDPDLVALQLDLFWIRRAGRDAVEYFERYPGRFPSVHLKDMATDGTMVDVGEGVIDWRRIFRHAELAGIQHYFVEHDQPDDPIASIERSLANLERLED